MNINGIDSNKISTKKRKKDIVKILNTLKFSLVSRLFWGRNNFYRNITHIIIITVTILLVSGGVLNRFSYSAATELFGYQAIGLADLLPQGGSIETVSVRDVNTDYVETLNHVVSSGEDLISIAQKYNKRAETIRWMNRNVVSPFGNSIEPGVILRIPKNMDGVMYIVKSGQNIYDIIRETGSNEFDVVEFNNLKQPYTLVEGQQLFIPDGTLYNPEISVAGIPRGVFSSPVSHPECAGYTISRGFLSYHNGVDIAKWPGCPIRAVAAGTVIYAGNARAMGFNVQIDHGGGIVTHYYHAREVYVTKGQKVQQNDIIMYMGTTGNSTGVHLHFTLFKDRIAIDPREFVPY